MGGAETEMEREAVELLFKSMKRVDLTLQIAQRAVKFRKLLRLRLPDAIILATADEQGCILVTKNTKDFNSSDPRIRVPYTA